MFIIISNLQNRIGEKSKSYKVGYGKTGNRLSFEVKNILKPKV